MSKIGLRVLAERENVVDSSALGPTAREEEPRLLAGRRPDRGPEAVLRAHGRARGAARRARGLVLHRTPASTRCSAPRARSAATTPTCTTAAPRPPRSSATTATPPTPGRRSSASSRSRCSATTARSTRSPGCARRRGCWACRSPRTARTRRTSTAPSSRSCTAAALSLVEAMELVLPPIVNEIKALPDELRGFYMYLRQAFGPFAQGPVALISRARRRVRVLGRRARPAAALAPRDRPTSTSSPPSRAWWRSPTPSASPSRSRPGEKILVQIDRRKGESRLRDHQELQRLCAKRWRERTGAEEDAGHEFAGAILTGGPLEGREIPGYTSAGPVRAGEGRGPRARRLRLAARGHEARAADGRHRRRADRLARLRRPAGLPLARAPEPGRLLQGVGGRGHQPGDRPRARGRALLLPRGVRPAARHRHDGRRAGHDRDRLPGPPRRPRRAGAAVGRRPTARSPRSTRRSCSRTSGRPSASARPRCSTSRASSRRPPRARSSASSRRPPPPSSGGCELLVLSDRTAYEGDRRYLDPHLALAAVDLALREHWVEPGETNLRRRCGIVLRSAALRNVHDVMVALGLGADGVCPYVMVEVALMDDYEQDVSNLCVGAAQGDREGHLHDRHPRGARLRAAVRSIGLKPELTAIFDTPGLRRLREGRHGLRRARRRRRRAPARARRRGGLEAREDVPLLPEGLQGGGRRGQRRRLLRGVLGEGARARARAADLAAPHPRPAVRPRARSPRRPPRWACTPTRS